MSKYYMPIQYLISDDYININAFVPGVEKESIDIEYKEAILHIKAVRERQEDALYNEMPHGDIARTIQVNDIDFKKGSAEYVDGVLKMQFPRINKIQRLPVR